MMTVADAGHGIGINGYTHEAPSAMTREQEIVIRDKCIEFVARPSGQRPTGYVAPWSEFCAVSNELLLARGIKYERSLIHRDHQLCCVRRGDT